jgi:hypothetical protein
VRRRTGQNRNAVSAAKNFSPSDSWSDVSLELPVRFADRRIQANSNVEWAIYIVAEAQPGKGTLYIDDIKVAEKK